MTTYDNVRAQHRLLTEGLGVERIRLATSWSMGACQVYAWAAAHPDMVDAIAPIAGSARTARLQQGLPRRRTCRAIRADPAWNDGFYGDRPPVTGVRAMAAIYAGWGFSEPFYREREYRRFGARDVPEFIDSSGTPFFLKCDANDLLAQMATWWHNDLGAHASFGGDFDAALRRDHGAGDHPAGRARPLLPAGRRRVRGARDAERRVPGDPGVWGHMAPVEPASQQFIDAALRGAARRLARAPTGAQVSGRLAR